MDTAQSNDIPSVVSVYYSRIRNYNGDARTLNPGYLGLNDNGWFIQGSVTTDYGDKWVNQFHARHHELGEVFGDFEQVVRATSVEALNDFLNKFPFDEWSY